MSFSGMVEIPRSFRRCSGHASGEEKVQGGKGVTNTENLDSRFRGKDGRGIRLPVDIVELPRLRAEGCLIKDRFRGGNHGTSGTSRHFT